MSLKVKIVRDELSLVKRTYEVALTETTHAEDELWDDR